MDTRVVYRRIIYLLIVFALFAVAFSPANTHAQDNGVALIKVSPSAALSEDGTTLTILSMVKCFQNIIAKAENCCDLAVHVNLAQLGFGHRQLYQKPHGFFVQLPKVATWVNELGRSIHVPHAYHFSNSPDY